MLSRRQLMLLAGSAARLAASAKDFWNIKPPAQWSKGEIYRLANQSPWAKPVQAWRPGITNSPLKDKVGVLPPTGYVFGPKGVVTWESAQPLRDAFQVALPPGFTDSYVIGVDGFALGDTPSLDSLSGSTVLRCMGKRKWTASVAGMAEVTRGSVVYLFGFARAPAPLGRDSGEVIFETQFGEWTVRARFRPRDMFYRGAAAV